MAVITERWKFSWVPNVSLFITLKMFHVMVQGRIHQKKNPNRLSELKILSSGSEDTKAAKFMRVKYCRGYNYSSGVLRGLWERERLFITQVSSEYWSVLAFEENTWGWREIYPDGLQRGLGAHIGPGIVFILTSWKTSFFTGTVLLVEYSERFYISSGTRLLLDWALLRM